MHNFAEFPERKVQKLGKNQFLISISKMDIIVNVSNVIDNQRSEIVNFYKFETEGKEIKKEIEFWIFIYIKEKEINA